MEQPQPSYVLAHIVAASENNVIGAQGALPWKLPNDFKYFKNKTWGMPVIMGRGTFESMPDDLPGRINIVVTRNPDWAGKNAVVTHTINEAIHQAASADAKEIFIIGGGELFKQTLALVSLVYLTRVHAVVDGDTYYPSLDEQTWTLTNAQSFPADEKHAFGYTFERWEHQGVEN